MKKIIFILSLIITSPALADMETAHKANDEGNYRLAFGEYLNEAKAGNTEAMIMVGLYYADGLHVMKSDEKANEWMLKAAEAGDPIAQRNIAIGYKFGIGNLTKDEEKAFEWFEQAAKQNELDSQFELASAYHYGVGIKTNLDEARLWYMKAADAGDSRAQYNLASMYASGDGVAQDTTVANMWLEKAVEKNNHEALFTMGLMSHNGDQRPKDFTAAADYFQRAFIEGKSEAAAYMAEYAYLGSGRPKDPVDALMWVMLGTEISSTMPGGQLTPQTLERLEQNRSFLEDSLDDGQEQEARERFETFMKDHLEQ